MLLYFGVVLTNGPTIEKGLPRGCTQAGASTGQEAPGDLMDSSGAIACTFLAPEGNDSVTIVTNRALYPLAESKFAGLASVIVIVNPSAFSHRCGAMAYCRSLRPVLGCVAPHHEETPP